MKRIGVRELSRETSAVVRLVASGETVEVTDRGRSVAVLLPALPAGLERLERERLLRPAEGDLLAVKRVKLPPGATAPSSLVELGRQG